jgi:hypothetical protein
MDPYKIDSRRMRKTGLSEIISTVHHGSSGTASFGHAGENNMTGDIYAARQRYAFVAPHLPD